MLHTSIQIIALTKWARCKKWDARQLKRGVRILIWFDKEQGQKLIEGYWYTGLFQSTHLMQMNYKSPVIERLVCRVAGSNKIPS